jgi:hypothetical protein
MEIFSDNAAKWLGVAVAAACALGAAACSSSSTAAGSGTASASSSAGTAGKTLSATQIVFGTTLKHTFRPNGTGAPKTESLSQPDDIVQLGGDLYVGFQNGVGSQGETAPSGNTDSTLAEFTPAGKKISQWDVKGKIDGLGADTGTKQVIATVNEDSNSSLYTVSPGSAAATHYTYSEALPHKGGTDSVAYYDGKLLISASAPGTAGKAPASAPAVFAATLNPATKVASVAPFFADNATATEANGAGKQTTLALTDPDSSEIVPAGSAKYAGDFMLDSQADQELIFSGASGKNLQVVKIPKPVDDSAWATSANGTLFTTDSTANTVDTITGSFTPGTMYTAVSPCNAANAPANCPAPGFALDSLGEVNLKTGAITPVAVSGVQPKGLIFVP